MSDMIKINASRKIVENLPPEIFFNLGIDQIAYIKTQCADGNCYYAVHSAKGDEISIFDTHEEAQDFIRFNRMMPITLH